MSDRTRRAANWPWQTWVFLILAVAWAVVAVFSAHHRELAIAFAVVAVLLAALNVSRVGRRDRD